MKKAFWLCGIALMMLLPLAALAADDDNVPNLVPAAEEESPNTLPPGEYWLGVQCRPGFEALRAQLHLPGDQGIIVDAVVPDSPAAKAGLAQYDVLLKADENKITNISDLQKAVEAAKDKEMKLAIIHDGQPKTIAITPAKRPEDIHLPPPPPQSDFEAFRKFFEQMQPGAQFGQGGPMRFRIFGKPGIILPPGALIHPPLPGNMSIVITKTGDKPADIAVKLGDEKWEVTEKDLDKLPEKVRPYVERMLGATTGMGGMRMMSEVVPTAMPPEPATPPGPGEPGGQGFRFGQGPGMNMPPMNNIESRIEKRLEEMSRRIERLQNELQQRPPSDRPPMMPPPAEKNKDIPPDNQAL